MSMKSTCTGCLHARSVAELVLSVENDASRYDTPRYVPLEVILD